MNIKRKEISPLLLQNPKSNKENLTINVNSKNKTSVRLQNKEIKIIKETAKEVFGDDVKVFIFGSRIHPNKRGGDIDILIKSLNNVSISEKLSFLAKIELKGISRKVDLLVVGPETKHEEIHKNAIETGVEI